MHAIVIGAGSGGLTTAIALQRRGIDAVVFDRAASSDKLYMGGSIHIWQNAMKVSRDLGIFDQVHEAGGDIWKVEFATSNGKHLAQWPVKELSESVGLPAIAIRRGDLSKVLTEAVADGVLQLGMECAGFTQDESGVTVRFADGREEHGDVLVGADGLRSTIRSQVAPEASPRYAGYSVWNGILIPHPEWCPEGLFWMGWGRGRRFAFYHVGDQRVAWFAVDNVPEDWTDPEGGAKVRLLRRFTRWAPPVENVIEATEESSIYRMGMYDLGRLPRWTQGRVALLGDAAHAMTFNQGQGACQAMEDAAVLARCLSEEPNVPAALAAYEARRIERTTGIAKRAWTLGVLGKWKRPIPCLVRDQFLRILIGGKAWKAQTEEVLYQY